MGGVGGQAAQQVGGGGCGDGKGSVSADDGAAADVDGRAVPGADLQVVNARAGGDDVDDGVDGSNFVEVDVVDGNIVDFGLGFAEQLEGADGGLLDGCGERRALNQGANGGERAAMGVGCEFSCVDASVWS